MSGVSRSPITCLYCSNFASSYFKAAALHALILPDSEKRSWKYKQNKFQCSPCKSGIILLSVSLYSYFILLQEQGRKHRSNSPLKSNKLNITGQFPILLIIVIDDQTFWCSSLAALIIHTFVMGFTYLTAKNIKNYSSLLKMVASAKLQTNKNIS